MRKSKVRAMDSLWSLTQHIHYCGYYIDADYKKREELTHAIDNLVNAGLSIAQIDELTTIIIDAYEIGKWNQRYT